MIIGRILKKDFLRKKVITIVVFIFIFLSALLVSSGVNLIVETTNSLNFLFSNAKTPHFVQMHAGRLDQLAIARWAAADDRVQEQQTVEMITIDGTNLFLGDSQKPEENSIMDISFVKQNSSFDYLLDLDNHIIRLSPGEVGVPLYYRQQRDVEIGDTIQLRTGSWARELTVAAFVRDSQMNPAIVHSKRFLVHEADFTTIHKHFPETEYLIEFRLADLDQLSEFSKDYLAAGLPQKGTTVDYRLFKTLNALTDGIVAGAVVVLSLLLMFVAVLCLRFTILATIEEDTKEIGVMKAMGIARRDIRRIYLAKYAVMGALAAVLGYLVSPYLNSALSGNIMLYLGKAPKSMLQRALPVAAAAVIYLMVILSCAVVLHRLNRISAVEALRTGNISQALKKSMIPNVNLHLGFRDIFQRFKMFWLLIFVFFFCAAIILIPVHFLTTMQSPSFISYMGIGQSDIRIDLRQSEHVTERFQSMVAHLIKDPDVEQFAPLVTSQYTLVQCDGSQEKIKVETGDFSQFPLDYVKGDAPADLGEIALSILNAREMEKGVGDTVMLLVNGEKEELFVSGIYQDVTNGGRTAKAVLPYDPESVLWYSVSLDLTSPELIDQKVTEYSEAFYPARVTDLEGYVAQTLGSTIRQLRKVTIVAVLVGLSVSVLITSLFLNMVIRKDADQIAVMRGIGFSLRQIRVQYLSRALIVLGMGIGLGTLFSNTLGQHLVSALWAMMGASQISFVINPMLSYLLLPLLLTAAVSITTLASVRSIKESNLTEMIME